MAEAGATVAGVCLTQVDINKPQVYGGLQFHGFGVDYQYGNYYRNIDEPTEGPLKGPLKSSLVKLRAVRSKAA